MRTSLARCWSLGFVAALACCSGGGDDGGTPLDGGGGDSAATIDASDAIDGGGEASTCGTCATGQRCCGARCVVADSCDFAVTGVNPAGGFQNGAEWVRLTGAGFDASTRVFLGTSRAPALALSATELIIQTPPGTPGPVDVIVQSSGKEASIPFGFTYSSKALKTVWSRVYMGPDTARRIRGEWPALAVLQDGTVLIAGGATEPDNPASARDDAELFTRSKTGDTTTVLASKMSIPRWRATAITLLSGKVLIVGGTCATCDAAKGADLFDPATKTFTKTKGSLTKPRENPRAVLLADGRVLIASADDPSFEVYDPKTDAFTLIDHTKLYPWGFVVRLNDGRVLVGAGLGVVDSELWDPQTGAFTDAGKLPNPHLWPTAHVLPDGRVLIVGGNKTDFSAWQPSDALELYTPDAGAGKWSTAPYVLRTPRYGHGSALVRDGSVLVLGGYTVAGVCSSQVQTVDRIDPLTGKVEAFTDMLGTNTELSSTTLLDGSVLAVGGGECSGKSLAPVIDFLAGDDVVK